VKNECTLHNFTVLAITVPKIVKVSKNLTKLWQKQFWLFFSETRCTYYHWHRQSRGNGKREHTEKKIDANASQLAQQCPTRGPNRTPYNYVWPKQGYRLHPNTSIANCGQTAPVRGIIACIL